MPSILKASVSGSIDGLIRTELWYDVVLVDGVYELTSYTIRHVVGRRKITKENGVNRLIMSDALSVSGRSKEFLDKNSELASYTLTKAERLALRSLSSNGLPPAFQLGWERENRGPMSPTFEQSVVAENETSVNGVTFTITNPTTGNLLVICHGNADGDSNSPSLSSEFANNETATPANFGPSMNILSKISEGDEGTSVVVTHTNSEADPNSGWFAEISGMVGVSFTDGFDSVADAGSGVTSRSSGSITTTIGDTLLIAAFGYAMDGSPTGFGYTNSFTQQAFIDGLAGASDHGTRVATRVVASTGTYTTTASWSGSTKASGTIGAFVIDADAAPTATVPASGTCINTYGETDVPGISIAAGTSAITSVATTATEGFTLTYDTTGTSVTVSGNGTNAATLLNGASEAEWTTVLDTLTMRGTTPDTDCTVTVIPTDGTLNDSEQFTVMCDPAAITITGMNANVIAAVASLQIRLLPGQTHDTITVTATDDAGSPQTSTSEFIVGLSSFFQSVGYFLLEIFRRRRRS